MSKLWKKIAWNLLLPVICLISVILIIEYNHSVYWKSLEEVWWKTWYSLQLTFFAWALLFLIFYGFTYIITHTVSNYWRKPEYYGIIMLLALISLLGISSFPIVWYLYLIDAQFKLQDGAEIILFIVKVIGLLFANGMLYFILSRAIFEIIEETKPDPIPEKIIEKEPIEEVVDSLLVQDELVEEVPVEKPKPVVNKRALYTGSSSSTDTEGTNQGITEGAGDQGKPHGYKESDDYTGQGGKGNGVSFNLGGRGYLFLEKPTAKFKEQGTVIVSIWVDKEGKVEKAQVRAKGTNILDENLKKIAVDAAYNSTFVKDNNAADLQRGTITYNFILMK